MKNNHSDTPVVPYEIAKQRALAILKRHSPLMSSNVADFIWPGHRMKPQGAGGAASRILKRMEKEGLARWTAHYGSDWGWIKTTDQ